MNSNKNPNGNVLSFDYVKENSDELLPILSEGSNHLYRILKYCVDNDIPTIACCAGHNIFEEPYITMEYNEKNRKQLNAVLNQLEQIHGINIMFSTRGTTRNNFNVTIYTHNRNRDIVFNTIASVLESNIEDEKLTDSYKIALDLAIKKDFEPTYTTITIFNKLLRKKYLLSLGIYDKDNDIARQVKRFRMQAYGLYSYLLSSKKLNILYSKLFTQALKSAEVIHINNYRMDELNSEISKDEDKISKVM